MMKFHPRQLFHIYNQGNNRRQVFFTHENYLHFLWKMRAYLPPFGDLINWCLMPNHFHWLFFVKHMEIPRAALRAHVRTVENQRRRWLYGADLRRLLPEKSSKTEDRLITLNDAIGLLQRSYTQGINKEKGWSGSLFRQRAKAKNGCIEDFFFSVNPDDLPDTRFRPGGGYAWYCFHYIHDNPVKVDLAIHPTDWPYSSARDYAGLRRGTLCNLELGQQLVRWL